MAGRFPPGAAAAVCGSLNALLPAAISPLVGVFGGTGVAMASYFGHLLGRRVAGDTTTKTALDGMPFASAPFYRGEPWFLPFAFAWYAFKDRFG